MYFVKSDPLFMGTSGDTAAPLVSLGAATPTGMGFRVQNTPTGFPEFALTFVRAAPQPLALEFHLTVRALDEETDRAAPHTAGHQARIAAGNDAVRIRSKRIEPFALGVRWLASGGPLAATVMTMAIRVQRRPAAGDAFGGLILRAGRTFCPLRLDLGGVTLSGAHAPASSGSRTRALATEATARHSQLALLWQILSGIGFPNQFFSDS